MMKIYARVESGIVLEIIEPLADEDGIEVPIELRFTEEFVATLIDITGIDPQPDQRWTYDGAVFSAPVAYQPTPAEIRASNTSTRDYLLGQAALAIAPLQDAVDLDEATAQEAALLKSWKQYRVAVNRIDLTLAAPNWPVAPA